MCDTCLCAFQPTSEPNPLIVRHTCGHTQVWYGPHRHPVLHLSDKVCPVCFLEVLAYGDATITDYLTQPAQPGTPATRYR